MGFTSSLGNLRNYQNVGYIAVPLLITEGVGAISGQIPTELSGFDIPRRLGADWLKANGVSDKVGSATVLRSTSGVSIILVSVGKEFSDYESWRLVGASVMRIAGTEAVNFLLPLDLVSDAKGCAQALVEGSALSVYDYKALEKDFALYVVPLENPTPNPDTVSAIESAIEEALTSTDLVNWAKRLIDMPPRDASPRKLAKAYAKRLEQEDNVSVEVWDEDRVKAERLGGLIGVGRGSNEPVRLVYATYRPMAGENIPHVVLVGKGITFDTGGISIKPADNMEKMKYDMAGGAAMIGAMRAIALLKPRVRVIGIVCASENMPDGKAQKPGDVQTAMSGKTIEIINTDAEGRLVLADGLTYAKQLGATHLIDAATLTGACVVALGMINAGAFSNDDATYAKFDGALAASGEKFWRLPLGEEYAEQIKSDIGDIKNTGGRWGGASTAAEFLKVFAEETPWIHLDIAGLAWVEDSKPYIAKGPSGVAVRSILEWVRSF